MDRITVRYSADDEIAAVFAAYDDYIRQETLTDSVERIRDASSLPTWDINGKTVYYEITKNK